MSQEASLIAHLFGMTKPAEEAKSQPLRMEKAAPAAALSPDGKLPPIGPNNKFAHILRRAMAKKASAKATPTPAKRKGATLRFDHLKAVPDATEAASAPLSAAQLILAAGAKSRTPSGTGAAAPTGLAARILDAGKRRRGDH
jgi:hypothetical protein